MESQKKTVFKILLIISLMVIAYAAFGGCATERESYDKGYDAGYKAGISVYNGIVDVDSAFEKGYQEGYSEGLTEIPDDFIYGGYDSYSALISEMKTYSSDEIGIDTAEDLLFHIQDDYPEIYKQIIDAYGIDGLPTYFEYYVLDEDNKICHAYDCPELKKINPYTATLKPGVDTFLLSRYPSCPICGEKIKAVN